MSHRHHHRKQKVKGLRKKKKFYQFLLFWFVLGAVIFIGVVVYLLLFLGAIQVTTIEVLGNSKIQSTAIIDLAKKDLRYNFLNIPTESIFIANQAVISSDILKTFSGIESAVVQKKYPKRITITIKERVPIAIFCKSGADCFSIDINGVIFPLVDTMPPDTMVLNQDISNAMTPDLGQMVMDKGLTASIVKIQQNLKEKFGIDIKSALVSNPLIFTTSENWKLSIDPTTDINLQITKLDALLSSHIPAIDRKKLQYIYLQYQDRAYYQ